MKELIAKRRQELVVQLSSAHGERVAVEEQMKVLVEREAQIRGAIAVCDEFLNVKDEARVAGEQDGGASGDNKGLSGEVG